MALGSPGLTHLGPEKVVPVQWAAWTSVPAETGGGGHVLWLKGL